jgi:hypothetical protein
MRISVSKNYHQRHPLHHQGTVDGIFFFTYFIYISSSKSRSLTSKNNRLLKLLNKNSLGAWGRGGDRRKIWRAGGTSIKMNGVGRGGEWFGEVRYEDGRSGSMIFKERGPRGTKNRCPTRFCLLVDYTQSVHCIYLSNILWVRYFSPKGAALTSFFTVVNSTY